MSSGTRAPWVWLRWRVTLTMVILAGAGLGLMGPTPHAVAVAASTVGSPVTRAGSAIPVTAYVVNYGSATVTPISTATNTAGPPIKSWRDPIAIAIMPHP